QIEEWPALARDVVRQLSGGKRNLARLHPGPPSEIAHVRMHPVAEQFHSAPDHLVGKRPDLDGEIEYAVAQLAVDALDLLDHGLGAAAEHRAALDRLVERQGAALVEAALPAVAALLVLEIARLLQHDAVRGLQAAHAYLVEVREAVRQPAPTCT